MANNDLSEIIKELKTLKSQFTEFKDDIPKIKKDIANEIAATWYEDIDEIFTLCIDKYYSYQEYKPKFYKRTYSLYHAYKLTNKNGIVNWRFGSEFMPDTHRVDNDYIYEYMFEKGYHGGAQTIATEKVDQWGEHPHDGSPWYRTMPPYYAYLNNQPPYLKWSKFPAVKKMPPAQRIINQLQAYQDGRPTLIKRNMQDAVEPAYDLVLGRYDLFS